MKCSETLRQVFGQLFVLLANTYCITASDNIKVKHKSAKNNAFHLQYIVSSAYRIVTFPMQKLFSDFSISSSI